MADTLAELKVKIDTDTKGLQKGLKGAETRMGKFSAGMQKHSKKIGLGMAAMGAAIVGAAALSVKSWASMGDEIAKMARKTGMSTEALSELRHAASLSGADLSTVEKAVKRMAKAISDADDGMATYVRAFEKIGLQSADFAGLKPEEAFLKIGEAIAGIEDPLKRAAIAQDLFGRAGMDLLPMFDSGAEGLKKMREEAHKLGIVFDKETAQKAEDLTDAIYRVEQSTQGLKNAIAVALAPEIEKAAKQIEEFIIKLVDWAKANPELIGTILKVGIALVGAGGLLIALNQIIVAVRGVAIALAVVHAFLGPAAWLKLAAGVFAAGLAVAAISQMIKTPKQTGPLVELSPGGRMPEISQPGGIVKKPTLDMVREIPSAVIPPLSGGSVFKQSGYWNNPEAIVPSINGATGGNTFNFTGPFMGNEEEASAFSELVLAKIRQSQSFRTSGLTS